MIKLCSYFLLVSTLLVSTLSCMVQSDGNASFFLESELMAGEIVGNYSGYPESKARNTFALSIGRHQNTLNNSWAKYFNFSSIGVAFNISDLDNPDVFGQEYSIMSFIILNTVKNYLKIVVFKARSGFFILQ